MIKGNTIIQSLLSTDVNNPCKVTITTFQVKNGVIHADKTSIIEIDDEVYFVTYYLN